MQPSILLLLLFSVLVVNVHSGISLQVSELLKKNVTIVTQVCHTGQKKPRGLVREPCLPEVLNEGKSPVFLQLMAAKNAP